MKLTSGNPVTFVASFFKIGLITTLSAGFCTNAICQTNIAPNFELSEILPSNQNAVYEARDYVKLQYGFNFKALPTENKIFKAKINTDLPPFPATYTPIENLPDPETRQLDLSLPVGTTAGNLEVTPNGAAVYTIPIFTPPGTAGMAPSVSVVYNSQAPNGLVGYGWNLSAISSISRIGRSIYSDGYVRGVELNEEDRFALDGNRLILHTPNATYGDVATEYRTQNETFSKITIQVDANGKPYYNVETKDGRILKYGYTENWLINSRVALNNANNSVIQYLLSEVSDRNGNFMRYYYKVLPDNEYYLDRITYTGNNQINLEPYNTLKFIYTTRTDENVAYLAGHPIKSSLLLSKILVSCENQLVRTYTFHHYYDLYSFLYKVTESGADGIEYNSTNFENSTSPCFTESINSSIIQNQAADLLSGDFNGDGYTDLVAAPYTQNGNFRIHSGISLYINNQIGGFELTDQKTLDGANKEIWGCSGKYTPKYIRNFGSDFLGHGREDLLISFLNFEINITKLSKFRIYWSDNNSTFQDPQNFPDYIPYFEDTLVYNRIEPTKGQFLFPGDFDGDGAMDFITILSCYDNCSYRLFLYSPKNNNIPDDGNGILPYQVFTNGLPLSIPEITHGYIVDWNGDGKQELMLIFDGLDSPTMQIYSFTIPPQGNIVTAEILYSSDVLDYTKVIFPGDFNGDRKTDFLYCDIDYPCSWRILYSKGDNFTSPYIFQFTSNICLQDIGENYSITIMDINADGKSDIILGEQTPASNDFFELYISNGNSFIPHMSSLGTNNIRTQLPIITGDFNGDGFTDLANTNIYTQPFTIHNFHPPKNHFLLSQIQNGLNNKATIWYSQMTDNNVYTKLTTTTNSAIINIQQPLTLVSHVWRDNGLGILSSTTYKYSGARFHVAGLGYLGFKTFLQSGISGRTVQSFDYLCAPAVGQPNYCYLYLSKSEIFNPGNNPNQQSDDELISEEIYTPEVHDYGNKHVFAYTRETLSKNYLTGTRIKTILNFDDYSNGNLSWQKTTYLDPANNELASVQENFSNFVTAGSWCLNKPENVTITRKRTGTPDIVNTTVNNWDASTGNLIYSENEEGFRTTNTYFLGLPTMVTESAADMESRIQSLEYDAKLRFVIKTINPLGHTTEQQYSSAFGSPVWSKDENGLITTNRYDGFGNPVETFWPNGKKSQISILWATPQSPEYCLYYTLSESEGRPWVKTYMDCLGRTLREETPGYNNLILHTNYQYNEKGQAFKSSFTDPLGEDQWVTRDFDINGRCTSEVSPVNTINYTYTTETDGYKTTATRVLPMSNQKSNQQKTDLTGMLVSSTDAAGKVEYSYNAAGQPLTVTVRTPSTGDPVTTSISYDNMGRQLSLNDPDAGLITYTYYKNGALKTQTNANLHTYTMQYDKLGRMISKSNPIEGNYAYFYDTEPNGIGKPATIQSPGNMSSSFQYDPFGRVIRQSENIAGVQSLQTSFEYDEWGNTTRLIYPGGYAIDYYYDNIGNLVQVKQGSDQTMIWQLNETDARGQISSCNTGPLTTQYFYTPVNGLLNKIKTGNLFNNSYEFDAQTGNLNWRKNIILNKTENFTYTPSLDQLASISSTGNPATSMSYMPNGNILSKSDVGSAEYQYSPLKPHAVETINSANSVISHDYQEITYTPFNKISSISENQKKLQFYYGTDQQRSIMQTRDLSSNALLKEKFYGSQYEKEVDYTTNTTRQWHYISGGDGLAAVYIKTNETGQLYFVAKDHLGSIIGLFNTSGTLVEEYSYDAWGRRRDPINWAPLTQTPNYLLTRGYTGHEHLDEFGLINMNGRLYDPVLGRMLSPDNYVQDASGTQNYNRYSYCLNNPLRYTDPSGEAYLWDDLLVAGAGFLIGYVSYGLKTADWGWKAVGQGAISAGLSLAGYYTCGLTSPSTIANGFAAGGFYNEAATVALGYSGRMMLTSASSTFLPSISIYSDETMNISISPSIILGSDGTGIGVNVDASINDNGLAFGASLGFTAYGNHGPSGSRFIEGRSSVFVGYIGDDIGLVYASNSYSGGGFNQTTVCLTLIANINNELSSLAYENDFMFGLPSDDGDRFRTAAVRIQYGQWSLGTNMFTGDPNKDGTLDMHNRPFRSMNGHDTYYDNKADQYRFGSLYLGYGNFKLGINGEQIRHAFQNRFAHDFLLGGEPKWFKVLNHKLYPYFSKHKKFGYSLW